VVERCWCEVVNRVGESLVFVELGGLLRQTKRESAMTIKRRQRARIRFWDNLWWVSQQNSESCKRFSRGRPALPRVRHQGTRSRHRKTATKRAEFRV
jgi:hypothetical protein